MAAQDDDVTPPFMLAWDDAAAPAPPPFDLAAAHASLRAEAHSATVRSYEWRLGQLEALRTMFRENHHAIVAAAARDLGKRNPFETSVTEWSLVVRDIEHYIKRLRSYMADERVRGGLAFMGCVRRRSAALALQRRSPSNGAHAVLAIWYRYFMPKSPQLEQNPLGRGKSEPARRGTGRRRPSATSPRAPCSSWRRGTTR